MANKPKKRKPQKKSPPQKRITTKRVQDTENLPPPKAIPSVIVKPEDDGYEDKDEEGLTIRRRLFVEAITGKALGNATKAAKLAGYSDSNTHVLEQTGSRLLSKVEIKKAISRRLAARLLNPAAIQIGIAEVAHADMNNFMYVGMDGQPVLDWKAAAAAGAISQIREYAEDGIVAGGEPTVFKRKFKLFDKLRALELLAKINGMLVDRKDITSNGETLKGYAVVSPDDWDSTDKPE